MLSASRVLFGILAPKSKSVSDETKKKGLKDRSRSTSKDQRKSDGLQPIVKRKRTQLGFHVCKNKDATRGSWPN